MVLFIYWSCYIRDVGVSLVFEKEVFCCKVIFKIDDIIIGL